MFIPICLKGHKVRKPNFGQTNSCYNNNNNNNNNNSNINSNNNNNKQQTSPKQSATPQIVVSSTHVFKPRSAQYFNKIFELLNGLKMMRQFTRCGKTDATLPTVLVWTSILVGITHLEKKLWIHRDAGNHNEPPCETWSELFHPPFSWDQRPSQNDW